MRLVRKDKKEQKSLLSEGGYFRGVATLGIYEILSLLSELGTRHFMHRDPAYLTFLFLFSYSTPIETWRG